MWCVARVICPVIHKTANIITDRLVMYLFTVMYLGNININIS